MLFSTILFLFRFLPITLLLYYISPPKLKNTTLFICSLVFYCWGEVKYFWIMAAVILINYICGLCIFRSQTLKMRRLFLVLSIAGSLSMLLYFKYTGFFLVNLNNLFGFNFSIPQWALPLGISFYTFQSLSYTIDVYWKRVPSESNLVNFGAYVVMFPQLIAGPIVRYRDVNERLHVLKGRVTPERIEAGVTLFIFGLAKKVLVADTINKLWTDIIGQYDGVTRELVTPGVGLENASTPLVWLGVLAYTIYIYFDFSGYSLMGIGMGKMLGFDFPDNFNLPYIARSITGFWRRWHISLSSWFREYVYIPLGGNRKGLPRQMLNIFIVWLLTGFWHGANWNFILWGLYYCAFLIIEKIFLLKHLEKSRVWSHIYTLVIVMVGWALFAGNDAGVTLPALFGKLFIPQGGVGALYYARNYIGPLLIGVLFSTTLPQKAWAHVGKNVWVRGVCLGVLLAACIAYMVAGGFSPFLYFNF